MNRRPETVQPLADSFAPAFHDYGFRHRCRCHSAAPGGHCQWQRPSAASGSAQVWKVVLYLARPGPAGATGSVATTFIMPLPSSSTKGSSGTQPEDARRHHWQARRRRRPTLMRWRSCLPSEFKLELFLCACVFAFGEFKLSGRARGYCMTRSLCPPLRSVTQCLPVIGVTTTHAAFSLFAPLLFLQPTDIPRPE